MIHIVGIYRKPSHGVRARFLSVGEKINNSFYSIELNILRGHVNIDLLKLNILWECYVDMMFSSSL